MREQEPMTQTMKASEARQGWSQLLNRVQRGGTRVVVEKSGIPVAAIISPQDLERFIRAEGEREERFKVLDRVRAKNADKDPQEEERFITGVVAEVRQERYDGKTVPEGGR